MRELTIVLSLVLAFAPGCGRMVVFQARSGDPANFGYDTDSGFMFKHVVVFSNTSVSREIHELPASHFASVQGAGLNCWRFKTRDGRKYRAADWDIDGYVDDSLVLHRDKWARSPAKVEVPETKKIEIERIVALSPMPIRAGETIILAERIVRSGPTIRLTDVYGIEHLLDSGGASLVDVKPAPYDRIYGFSTNDVGVRLESWNVGEFLDLGATSADSYDYSTVRLTDVQRWEFEKEWLPTVILVTFGIMLPVGLAALGAQWGEPSRCSGDHRSPAESGEPSS